MDDFDEIMNLQRQLASRVVHEQELELQMKMLDIFGSLVTDRNRQVQKAKILAEAEIEGISEDDAARILKKLEDLNYIRQVRPGYYEQKS